jgi:RNA polymerase sigma-70 factor (ECF subfamily)
MDEQNAVTRLKQGDLEGLKGLVEKYQIQAVRAAYLILNDQSLAEGVVQKAFLKAARRIHQFDESFPFYPWFYRIVINDALKQVRAHKRLVSLEEAAEGRIRNVARLLTDPKPQPDAIVETVETHQDVRAAIRSLPPEQRAAVVMFYYLDMSMSEMAEQTQRPLSTIKWWLRDARSRLKRLINVSPSG